MQIFISVIINIIILAVILPLFYIYIVSNARERLEKETISKARDEIEALVKEFNNIALARISILEDSIARANNAIKKLNNPNEDNVINENKKKEDKIIENGLNLIIEENINELNEQKNKKLDIRISQNDELQESIKLEEQINESVEDKSNDIDTVVKAIDDKSKKEKIEKLRNKLDETFKNKMSIYGKKDDKREINKELEEYTENKSKEIIELYKKGLSKKEISDELKCSITEIDIVIDLEM